MKERDAIVGDKVRRKEDVEVEQLGGNREPERAVASDRREPAAGSRDPDAEQPAAARVTR